MRCWLVAQSVGGGAVLAGFSVSQRRAGRFVKTSSIHPWRLRRVIPDAEALLHGPPAASFSFGVACAAGCRFGYRLRRFLWLRCCLRRWVSLWKSSVPLCRADVKHRIHILKHRVRGARGPEPVGGPPAPGKARAEAPWMALCRSAERSGPLATGTCQGRKPAPDRAANRRPPDHDQHTRDPYHKSESSKRNQLISIHNLTNLM